MPPCMGVMSILKSPVVDVDELDLEAAELEPVARFFGEDLRVIQ